MSILLEIPTAKTNLITKSKPGESKTSSILLISAAISIALVLLVFVGLTYTDGMIGEYSACRDKIIGFEQHGMYGSPEQFKLALTYCEGK
ncbi:MAG TPA: hypothetical protein VK566_09065 [Nitrososphaeraceae archaeon]|nr:hypothetical protein [Nitrososphaeraceae archaeon]